MAEQAGGAPAAEPDEATRIAAWQQYYAQWYGAAAYGDIHADGPELPPGVQDGVHTVQASMRKGSVVLWAGGTLHGTKGRVETLEGLLAIALHQ